MRVQFDKPKPRKWTCWLCGRMPCPPKQKKTGSPRYEKETFNSKKELDKHVAWSHP